MTHEQTAAKIVADALNSVCETSMEAAIVAALRQAFEAGRADAISQQEHHEASFAAGAAAERVRLTGDCDVMGRHPNSPYTDRIIDCTGPEPVVRRVKQQQTNTDGPIYGTAMFIGETVMVVEAAAKEASK